VIQGAATHSPLSRPDFFVQAQMSYAPPLLPVRKGQPLVTDRREFIRCAACGLAGMAALSLAACGGADAATAPKDKPTVVIKTDTSSVTPTGDPKFEVSGSQVKVFLSRIPDLDAIPSFLLIGPASTIVLHTGPTEYDAFSAVCTHAGCLVNGFSSANHMVCPCHGSEFDLSGNAVAGPAPSALTRFTVVFDATVKTLIVNRSV